MEASDGHANFLDMQIFEKALKSHFKLKVNGLNGRRPS